MKKHKVKYDLQERVIDFAVDIISLVESLSRTKSVNHIGGQVLHSGTAPAFNYAEAQRAESRSEFVQKMKICLRGLRETQVGLKVVCRLSLSKFEQELKRLLKECAELVSVFMRSIQTAKRNMTVSFQQ